VEHQSAIDHRFAERYLLEELSPEETAEFEAHFFECALCADEVRLGAHLVANLKAVLREPALQEVVLPVADTPIEIRPGDRFLDLRIALGPSEAAPRVSCEFHFAASPAFFVMTAFAGDGSLRLRLPAERFPPGACTVVLRDKDSQRELGQRQLLIARTGG
jgi:anti-sigma factor RsiW